METPAPVQPLVLYRGHRFLFNLPVHLVTESISRLTRLLNHLADYGLREIQGVLILVTVLVLTALLSLLLFGNFCLLDDIILIVDVVSW